MCVYESTVYQEKKGLLIGSGLRPYQPQCVHVCLQFQHHWSKIETMVFDPLPTVHLSSGQ